MHFLDFIFEVHFVSPFLMLASGGVLAALFFLARFKRQRIPSAYIGFFGMPPRRSRGNSLFWIYRLLPYVLSIMLVLAIGAPFKEEYKQFSKKPTLYTLIIDHSGSTVALNMSGEYIIDFQGEDSVLNTVRTSLMRFVRERKADSEFFLLPFSDTPYAARYFAGGEEAEIQIVEYLEKLPQTIQRLSLQPRRFYLEGTHTAFAIDAAGRLREYLPEGYQHGAYVVITDFRDSQSRVAQSINSLIENGLRGRVYVIVVSGVLERGNTLSQFQRNINYPEQVSVFLAESKPELDSVFSHIGRAESSSVSEVTYEALRRESLQHFVIYAFIAGLAIFIGLGEFLYRRIP